MFIIISCADLEKESGSLRSRHFMVAWTPDPFPPVGNSVAGGEEGKSHVLTSLLHLSVYVMIGSLHFQSVSCTPRGFNASYRVYPRCCRRMEGRFRGENLVEWRLILLKPFFENELRVTEVKFTFIGLKDKLCKTSGNQIFS